MAEERRRHDDELKLLRGLIEKDERPTTGKLGLEGIKLTKLRTVRQWRLSWIQLFWSS